MKILIVEDDFVVRQGIKYSLDWENYGLTICGDAPNGKMGLEMALRLDPEIIITDIRMPIMDGLEFAELLLDQKPNAKVIILSGYDDFAYAKKAIHLGVYDYLLKPVDADELLKCICKLRDEILKEEEEQKNRENQELLMAGYQNELFDHAMGNLIKPAFAQERQQIERELAVFGVTLSSSRYKIAVLAIENFLLLTRNHTKEEKNHLSFQIRTGVKNIFEKGCFVECFENDNSQIVILLGYENASELYLGSCFQKLTEYVTREIGFLCTIACGREKSSPEEICISYQEAILALRHHASQNESHIYQYTDDDLQGKPEFLEVQEEEKQLLDNIQKYNVTDIEAYINSIFDKALADNEPYEKVNSTCLRLVANIYSLLEEMGIVFRDDTYNYQDTRLAIRQYHATRHLKEYMLGFIRAVSECLEKTEKKKYSHVVNEAISYVEKNYKQEISVKTISTELFITPNYFSQIFKSQIGMNFTDYLNKVRIEHAKKYLKDSSMKVYEVAENCGYQNYKYFNMVFKKYTGYSPKEYRNGAV